MIVVPRDVIARHTAAGWWGTATLVDAFERNVRERPAREAVVDPPNRAALMDGTPQRLSWTALGALVERLAAILAARGVGPDGIVCTQLPNCVEQVATYLACLRLGAVITPVPMQYREHEIEYVLGHTGAATIVTCARFHHHAHAVIADAAKLIGPLPTPGAKVGKDMWWKAWNYGTNLQRLTLKARSVPADAAIAEMTRLRAALATEATAGMQAEQLRDDVAAMLDSANQPPAVVKEEAARILERLKSEGARKLEFSALGEVYAMLGDEATVRTVIGAMKQGETDWEIPDKTRALCVVMAKRGHIEAALKCAPQLTGSQNWQKANRVAVYAAVLRAMTTP